MTDNSKASINSSVVIVRDGKIFSVSIITDSTQNITIIVIMRSKKGYLKIPECESSNNISIHCFSSLFFIIIF
jgi:hypothetical protein